MEYERSCNICHKEWYLTVTVTVTVTVTGIVTVSSYVLYKTPAPYL